MTTFHLASQCESRCWVWVFGRGPIHVRGQVIDLDAETTDLAEGAITWADAVDSATRYLATVEAPLLRTHADSGHEFGHTIAGQTRTLTPEEQIAAGIPERLALADAFFAEVEITDPATQEQHTNGQLAFTSMGLSLGATLNNGDVFPLAVTEISITAKPVVKVGQVPIRQMAEVRLSDQGILSLDLGAVSRLAGADITPDTPTEVDMSENTEKVDALRATLAETETTVAKLTADNAAMTATLSERDATIATLTEEKVRHAAAEQLAGRKIEGDAKTKAIELAVTSPEAFAILVDTLAEQPKRTVEANPFVNAQTEPEGDKIDLSDRMAVHKAALALKETDGLSYSDAITNLFSTTTH